MGAYSKITAGAAVRSKDRVVRDLLPDVGLAGSLTAQLNFPHMSLTGPRKNSYENTWQRGDEAMSCGGSQRINSSQTLYLSADMTGKENAPSSSSTREYKTMKEEHD